MGLTDNVAEVSLVADYSRLASGLRVAAKLVNDFGSGANASMGKLGLRDAKKGQSWASHATGQVAGNLAMRGIDLIVDQGKAVIDFEENLTRLGIAANLSKVKLDEIRTAATATSVAIGVDKSVVLDSYRAYIDLAGAQNGSITKMNLLANAGQATGAAGKDLAGMMYQLTRSMKVTDEQMEETMGGLINQAKEGAIEAKQMAAEFSGMMPIFARFGVVGREGTTQLGAMYQVTRDGFDSASQAATGMIRLMAGLQRHANRFKAHGVEVFKPGSKKDLRQLSDIMEQIKKSPLNKDIQALIKSFGRSEAWRTFELLAEAPQRLRELEQAGRANGVIMKDLGTFTTSSAGRMAISMEKMKKAVAEAFTPERIEMFAKAMENVAIVVDKIAKGVGFVADKVERMTRGTEMDAEANVKKEIDSFKGMTDEKRAYAIRAMQERANKIEALGSKGGMEGRREEGFLSGVTKFLTPNLRAESDSFIRNNAGWDPWAVKNLPKDTYKDPQDQKFADQNKAWAETQMPKMAVQAFKDIAQTLKTMIKEAVNDKPTVVAIDGNPVAKASGNATDARRK